MRVLSIDLDYCMDTCMEMICDHQIIHYMDDNPVARWKSFRDHTNIPYESVFIDSDKVEYCWDVYQKALKHCDDVMFGYDHDAILYRLEMDDAYDLEIINIDYHGDMSNGEPYHGNLHLFNNDTQEALDYEYSNYQCGKVMEGNWVGWLGWKQKLNEYTWIHGTQSEGSQDPTVKSVYDDSGHYSWKDRIKEDYEFDNYEFDFIFVCLSPMYIPQKFWNIFPKYLTEYEKVKGKKYKLINRKYEIDARYRELHKYTLPRNR